MNDIDTTRTPASPDTYKILTGPFENATKLNAEIVEAHIMRIQYEVFDDKVVFCMLHMKNGFVCKGVAGVVDPANFILEKGKGVSREDAVKQAYLVMGYQLQTELAMKRIVEV